MLSQLTRTCAKQLQGLATPAASGSTPAGPEFFNGEPVHSGRALPAASLADVPSLPRLLGLAGAIPFLALAPPVAAALPFLPADLVANAGVLQVGYGVSIVSFLGGIHWAMAMAEYGGPVRSAAAASERYLWSVTPCLMAWPAVSLAPGPGSLVVAGTLAIAYGVDRSFASKGLLPPWYLALRLPLTLAAVAGMSLTLVASVREAEAAVPHEAEAAAPRNAAGQAAAGGGTAGAQEMELAAQPRSRQ